MHIFPLDIDECSLELHRCHKYANCVNQPGSYGCVCKSGWTGDGLQCDGKSCRQEHPLFLIDTKKVHKDHHKVILSVINIYETIQYFTPPLQKIHTIKMLTSEIKVVILCTIYIYIPIVVLYIYSPVYLQ